jgi:glycosyltransferase involved in cell wall biosynthesis
MTGAGASRRVLLVSHYYPPHLGGIENVVRHEAVHLALAGAEVTVLTSGDRTAITYEAGPTPSSGSGGSGGPLPVRVVRIAAWNGIERRAGVPFPVLSPRVLAAARRWAAWADVVHLHDCLYMTSWAGGAAAALTGTPLVLTQHVAMVGHPARLVRAVQKAVYAVAGRGLLRRARRVLVVNAAVAAFAIRHGAHRATVRHFANGVDTDLFRPAGSPAERTALRGKFGLPDDRVLVLFAGRLVPKKGYHLLRAAADPAYDLVFAGSGAGGAEQPGPGLHHLGALSPAEMADAYRACDVFALPSTDEGFPLTVQEAMSSGLPVVTTDDPGYAPYELDRDHVTLLPRDAKRLREALHGLAADRARRDRMARYSRAYAADGFTWSGHADSLLRIYAEVTRPRAGAAG